MIHIGSAYVISLARTPRRLSRFNARFPAYWPVELPRPHSFPAVDGNIETPRMGYQATLGAWGCLQSHLKLARKWDGEDPMMVFEDDAQLVSDAGKKIVSAWDSVPNDADMLYIGGQHFLRPEPIAPGLVRCREMGRTHAFVLFPKFRDFYIQLLQRCPTHVDHYLQWWQKNSPEIFCYAIDPVVALQMEGPSSVVDGKYEPVRSFDWLNRVDCKVRKVEDVPIVWLKGDRATAEAMRSRGEIHYGQECEEETGYCRNMVIAARMNNPEDQGTEILRWINRELPYVACFERASLAVWHPDVTVEAMEIVRQKHKIQEIT